MKITAAITAVGGYVPEYVLTNQELETMVDTTDQWILDRTGISERRILKGDRASSDMAVEAIADLLRKRSDIDVLDIELIICATVSPDHVHPATANIIAGKIGAAKAWGFDVNAACCSFLFSLQTGAKFIEAGTHKKVLVVGVDKMSCRIDYEDRNTCILFGDGGGVVLLEPDNQGFGVLDAELHSDGTGYKFLHQKAGGSKIHTSLETVLNRQHYIYQDGKTVFKYAVKGMADVTLSVMEKNGLTGEDIAFLVPHQANNRIISATAERAGLSPEKVMVNIQRYGNTTSATIPLCLWEWEKQLKKGDNLILAAFGGGFTWGAIWVKWAY